MMAEPRRNRPPLPGAGDGAAANFVRSLAIRRGHLRLALLVRQVFARAGRRRRARDRGSLTIARAWRRRRRTSPQCLPS